MLAVPEVASHCLITQKAKGIPNEGVGPVAEQEQSSSQQTSEGHNLVWAGPSLPVYASLLSTPWSMPIARRSICTSAASSRLLLRSSSVPMRAHQSLKASFADSRPGETQEMAIVLLSMYWTIGGLVHPCMDLNPQKKRRRCRPHEPPEHF